MRSNTFESIINALPGKIAALNQSGEIIWQNKTWKEFIARGGDGVYFKGGQKNIFESFGNLNDKKDVGTRLFEKFHSVINGECDNFSLDYSVGTDNGPVWYRIRVDSVTDEVAAAIVQLEEITDLIGKEVDHKAEIGRFEKYTNSMPAGIVVQGNSGEIIYANQIACQILRLDLNNLLGKKSTDSDWEMINEEGDRIDGENHPAMVTLRTGQPQKNIIRGIYSRNEEQLIWLLINSEPVYNAVSGEIQEVIVTFNNITELTKTQKQLINNEKKYQKFIDSLHEGVFVLSPDGIISYINASMCEMVGYSTHEITGKPISLLLDDYWQQFIPELLEMKEKKEYEVRDFEFIRNDKSRLYALIQFSSLIDNDQNFLGIIISVQDITANLMVEQALQESQRKLLTLMSNIPGVMYRCLNDQFWTMEFISEGCKDLTGYDVADLQFNRTIDYASIVHPDDGQRVWNEIQPALRDHLPFEITYRIVTAQGDEKWVWEKGRGVYSSEDELIAVEGFIADISHQIIAQEELKKRESMLRSIFSAAPSGIGVVKQRINLQVNKRFNQMLGYSNDEVIGKSTRIFYDTQEEFDRIGRELYRDLKGDEPTTIETRLRTKSGNILDILMSSTLLDPDDPEAGNVFVITDISEQKRAQEKLQISENRYRMLFEKMQDGFALFEVVFDESGKPIDHKYLEINPAYENFTGLKAGEIQNKLLRDVVLEVKEDWIQKFADVAVTGKTIRFEQYSERSAKTFEIFSYSPQYGQFAMIISDITERKKAEQKLLELSQSLSELVRELRCLYESSILLDDDKTLEEKIEHILNIIPSAFRTPEKVAIRLCIMDDTFTSQNFRETEHLLSNEIKAHGEVFGKIEIHYLDWHNDADQFYFSQEELSFVVELSTRLGQIIARQRSEAARKESEARWRGIFDNSIDGILLFNDEGEIKEINQAASQTLGHTRDEVFALHLSDLLISEDQPRLAESWSRFRTIGKATAKYDFKHKNGTIIPFETRASAYVLPGLHLATLRNLTEKKRHQQEQDAILSISAALRAAQTKSETITILLESLKNKLNLDSIGIAFQNREKNEFRYEMVLGKAADMTGQVVSVTEDVAAIVQKKIKPYIKNETLDGPDIIQTYQYIHTKTLAVIPLVAQKELLGLIFAGKETRFEEGEVRILMSTADVGANAILRSDLYEVTRRRLNQIEALHQIDLAINANTDLNSTLDVFLEQVLLHMKVDAADILIFEESTQSLVYATGKGFNRKPLNQFSIRLGNGYSGMVALTRRLRFSGDLTIDTDARTECNLRWSNEGFMSYCGVPLIAKGKVKGVLELFHRSLLQPDRDWFKFLDTMAGQAAIAIDNATLFNRLEQSHMELMLAFDTTLEGWARSLELHELESMGHTKRTVTLAQMLASETGLTEDELVQFRRGALLHDIGKIAIPHSILNKPGKLNDEEWKIVRQHPQKAFEILSGIPFLQPALDIPYYHHEKWDGTGYPHGMSGEQIPIAARIFALVDVWDALTSDRPFRKAWNQQEAVNYLRDQAGKHFDPTLVEPFIQLVFQTELQ